MNLYAIYKRRLPEPPALVREFVGEVINDGFLDEYDTWRMHADMGGSGVYADIEITELKDALDAYAQRKGLSKIERSELCVWINGLLLDREVYDNIDRYATENDLNAAESGHIRNWFRREMADSAISSLLTL